MMSDDTAKRLSDKILSSIFKRDLSVELPIIEKTFTFDINLPIMVQDTTTGEITWADSKANGRYITNKNMQKIDDTTGWIQEKVELKSLEQILKIWDSINYTTTERIYDSTDVIKSDTIYRSINIYRSTCCNDSKNLIFCDSCIACEYLIACKRSNNCNFCLRCDDSVNCSNSYNIICSNKIVNCFFIQDCFNLYECMFCSHISSRKFCIANMQFTEEEYYSIKEKVVDWIIGSLK